MTSTESVLLRRASILAACIGIAASAHAQRIERTDSGPARAAESTNTYGTSSLTCYTIQSLAFNQFAPNTTVSSDSEGGRFPFTGLPALGASVLLPAGAVVDHFELEACNTNTTVDMNATLFQCTNGSCSPQFFLIVPKLSGCTRVSSPVGDMSVDNQANSYLIEVDFGALDGTTDLRAARVYYRLEVSPAPAVATFADVPTTSPLFKFVEALVSAGITAGCGQGNYCPASPVTRGQLAVFLATALGLHFPN